MGVLAGEDFAGVSIGDDPGLRPDLGRCRAVHHDPVSVAECVRVLGRDGEGRHSEGKDQGGADSAKRSKRDSHDPAEITLPQMVVRRGGRSALA
jgi:hypothetical protein